MKLSERKAAERRFAALQLVVEGGGAASEAEIFAGLDQIGFDLGLTEDVVRDDVRWLQRRDLVTYTLIANTMMMVRITRHGIRVVEGRIEVDGMIRPVELS